MWWKIAIASAPALIAITIRCVLDFVTAKRDVNEGVKYRHLREFLDAEGPAPEWPAEEVGSAPEKPEEPLTDEPVPSRYGESE